MSSDLSAAGFLFNQQIYLGEFENLLSKIVVCYNLMLQDNVQLPNDENRIRDALLLGYLKKDEIRKRVGLTDFLFDREVVEDFTIGRTDIKIQTKNSFERTEAYYIIECKRLDVNNTKGVSGLNGKYIENGICRFVTNYYSSFYKVNAMIGFIVAKLNIQQNIDDINFLLKNHFPMASTTSELQNVNFIPGCNYHYRSKHQKSDQSELYLYHLMLDVFSQISN